MWKSRNATKTHSIADDFNLYITYGISILNTTWKCYQRWSLNQLPTYLNVFKYILCWSVRNQWTSTFFFKFKLISRVFSFSTTARNCLQSQLLFISYHLCSVSDNDYRCHMLIVLLCVDKCFSRWTISY